MEHDLKALISQMSLEEKAGLCSGLDFWHTKPVERLGVPSIMMTDGPHGLRKQADESDQLGIAASVPATCFPSGAALACSWDRALLRQVGEAIGDEAQAQGVSIVLGPAVNIKRSPLCGRNFEYYSEDPLLSTELAAAYIEGVQSRGVGTSLKHFAANNQETNRLTVSAEIDERTLREIYLASFEGAVKQAQPWTVMCCYNRINGVYGSENQKTLTDILKNEWGHQGFVVSDWGAVNERADGLRAGLELEMPASGGVGDRKIVEAVRSGSLDEAVLDRAAERILKIVFRAQDSRKPGAAFDTDLHHALARKAETRCAVLLKNEDGVLPLARRGTLAVIGGFAERARYQGGGSSHINPTRLESPLACLRAMAGETQAVTFAPGYRMDGAAGMVSGSIFSSAGDEPDDALIRQACENAVSADVAVIFAGLPESYESEGFDRRHLRLPDGQNRLIEAVAKAQPNTVVVLSNGAPVEMPWANAVKGILEGYLGGQAFGAAAADLLFGDANPSGKLAETFPKKLSDNPAHLNFPGGETVEYREGLFVGYRYYEKKELAPLFAFGHGLSYTTFEYADLRLDITELTDAQTVTVRFTVQNTGARAGSETAQLYVRDPESRVIRPCKELKGFEKVTLAPGEKKTVSIELGKRAFAFYDTETADWLVEDGDFEILVGAASDDIRLRAAVRVTATNRPKRTYTLNSRVVDLMEEPAGRAFVDELLRQGESRGLSRQMFDLFLRESPLRMLVQMSGGLLTEETAKGLVAQLNG